MTRTPWQKYLPLNCAPMPILWVSAWIFRSKARSRNARPWALPLSCRLSRYRYEASLTVSPCSALNPPTTNARYGGHAAVPAS